MARNLTAACRFTHLKMVAATEDAMADENSGPKPPKRGDSACPVSPGLSDGRTPTRDRDFGDSAGYGAGGSALDFHDVGDEGADPVKGKRNPLDAVMDTETSGSSSSS
jgi:hypothetical protein